MTDDELDELIKETEEASAWHASTTKWGANQRGPVYGESKKRPSLDDYDRRGE